MLDLVQDAVRQAQALGATDAECTLAEGNEFSVSVRKQEVENLKESGSRGLGLRVLIHQRTGSAYTSDLSRDGVARMVRAAIDNASVTTDDPFAGLPDPADLGQISADLGLYSDSINSLSTPEKIELARRAEQAAFDFDPRITNSEGAGFDSGTGARYFANSRGFAGSYRTSSCSITCVPVAQQEDGSMERDWWYSSARSPEKLEAPDLIGRIAAERTLRRLGARKIPTQKAAIVLDPRMARSLIGHIFEAISGDSVYRQASFLAGKLGQQVAGKNITVTDDGTIAGLWGTSPFDDEGVPSRRTVVIQNGVLQSYLLNTYTARKLGLKTTGNASRGLSGAAAVGHGNFFLSPGHVTPEDLIRSTKSGLYVTEMLGFGVNTVNGDFSQGASGLWIENGEFAYPVREVTIASSLPDMLHSIDAIANDLEFRSSMAAPTLRIAEMMISGS
ncbi:MAG: TldD/PmbA family protein [Bryobacteraceae bacterium]|nr:TldD/PmbA family protein [Bryobacteraceae bacterium]